MYHETWHALGSEVTLFLRDATESEGRIIVPTIKNFLSAFEGRFSRFRRDSELSLLNASFGTTFTVSREMMALLLRARELWNETDGIFDPLVLPQLERAGYVHSFGEKEERVRQHIADADDLEPHSFDQVMINEVDRAICLPVGAKLDLGGIGKGYASDLIAESLSKEFKNFWISLGGDMHFVCNDISGPWRVGVQDPAAAADDIFDLELSSPDLRAVATSGTAKRRFLRADGSGYDHHIIDPRSGRPAAGDVVAATIIADSATRADVIAKCALILGSQDGVELINRLPNAEGVLFNAERQAYRSNDIERFIKQI